FDSTYPDLQTPPDISTTCNECNLAKHVWAFPFNSWSIISLHSPCTRSVHVCAHESGNTRMRNRLHVLVAQGVFITAAAAMAQNTVFCRGTRWIHEQKDTSLDRLILSGI